MHENKQRNMYVKRDRNIGVVDLNSCFEMWILPNIPKKNADHERNTKDTHIFTSTNKYISIYSYYPQVVGAWPNQTVRPGFESHQASLVQEVTSE